MYNIISIVESVNSFCSIIYFYFHIDRTKKKITSCITVEYYISNFQLLIYGVFFTFDLIRYFQVEKTIFSRLSRTIINYYKVQCYIPNLSQFVRHKSPLYEPL